MEAQSRVESRLPGAGPAVEPARPQAIAVTGIACRFPGAHGPEEFWRLLSNGMNSVSPVPAERSSLVQDAGRGSASQRAGYLTGIDAFDAAFFGISPREARSMDPQQRLLLETAWEALEDAGQPPAALSGSSVGVFVGGVSSHYWDLMRAAGGDLDLHAVAGAAGRGMMPARISFCFDLRGPSVAVDAACASSLTAVHMACQSLWAGETDLCLAGGVNLILAEHEGEAFAKAGMLSPDGHCKFGDPSADGFVRAEGVAVVALRPLARALADGDRIYAIVRGSASGNDGRASGSMMTPSAQGQEQTLRAAYRAAGVDPADVDYVEAHGTGTAQGDGAELAALDRVLGARKGAGHPCLVGSVKSNIGHTEAAAGLAGFIKVALSLWHGAVPPTLHLSGLSRPAQRPESRLEFATALRPWPERGHPPVAGVSSFGLGGNNVHTVLTAVPSPPALPSPPADSGGVLPLSASSPAALAALAVAYRDHLTGERGRRQSVQQVCYNAGARRGHHEWRAAFQGDSAETLARELDAFAGGGRALSPSGRPRLAFVFPGQGAQWVGMGRELLATSPVFRDTMRRCDAAIRAETGWSALRRLAEDTPLTEIDVIQPLTWAFQTSLAQMFREWGLEPDVLIGHSLGEVAAAVVSGALSIADAAAVVCRRSRLFNGIAGRGGMAAVQIGAEEAEELVAGYRGRLSVAVYSSPSSVVLAGDLDALDEVLAGLAERGVFCRLIRVDIAAHSPQVEPLGQKLIGELRDVQPGKVDIPLFSTVFCREVDGTELGAEYWNENMLRPVLFTPAVRSVLDQGDTCFLEISPHPLLTGAVEEIIENAGGGGVAVHSLRRAEPELPALRSAVGALYTAGIEPDWAAVNGGRHPYADLPTYPWQRRRFWIRPPAVRRERQRRWPRIRRGLWLSIAGQRPPVPVPVPPSPVATPQPSAAAPRPAVAGPRFHPAAHVEHEVSAHAAAVLGYPAARLARNQPLTSLGLDSLLSVELRRRLRRELGVEVPLKLLLGGATIARLAEHAGSVLRDVNQRSA